MHEAHQQLRSSGFGLAQGYRQTREGGVLTGRAAGRQTWCTARHNQFPGSLIYSHRYSWWESDAWGKQFLSNVTLNESRLPERRDGTGTWICAAAVWIRSRISELSGESAIQCISITNLFRLCGTERCNTTGTPRTNNKIDFLTCVRWVDPCNLLRYITVWNKFSLLDCHRFHPSCRMTWQKAHLWSWIKVKGQIFYDNNSYTASNLEEESH